MPQDYKQDLAAIKEWMSKEPHIPQDIGKFQVPCIPPFQGIRVEWRNAALCLVEENENRKIQISPSGHRTNKPSPLQTNTTPRRYSSCKLFKPIDFLIRYNNVRLTGNMVNLVLVNYRPAAGMIDTVANFCNEPGNYL